MSGTEMNADEGWKEAFLDNNRRITPSRDYQPGWMLTAIGLTLCLLALFALAS